MTVSLRERIAELEEENAQLRNAYRPPDVRAPLRWRLSPQQEALLLTFLRFEYVTLEMGLLAMRSASNRDKDYYHAGSEHFRVQLCRLRKRLRAWGAPACFEIVALFGGRYHMPRRAEASQWLREDLHGGE